jgi:hypothetical protein
MKSNAGKIYVLRNSALKGTIVKVGRTMRTSEERAKEISNATGVPLGYEVLYEDDVLDCVLAEQLVHKYLEEKRINPKREFFDVPLKEVVRIVLKTCLKVDYAITSQAGGKLWLFINVSSMGVGRLDELKSILKRHPGQTPVYLGLDTKNYKSVQILVGKELYVTFSAGLINDLQAVTEIHDIEWNSQEVDKSGVYSEKIEAIDYDF